MITRCVHPAGHSMTRHARASSPALSVLSGPRTRDSISWRCRASPLDKEVLRFFLPSPDQSLPSFSSLLSVDLGPPPAPCPSTPPPSMGSTGLPSLQDTHSSVLARLDSLESPQHSGGGGGGGGERFDPAFDGSCPGTCLGRACSSLLTLTSTGQPQGFLVSWST